MSAPRKPSKPKAQRSKVIGRPTLRSPDMMEKILSLIASGESVAAICKRPGFPTSNVFYEWLRADDVFQEKYARAREAQADAMDDKILHTANTCTQANAQAARVKIDAYKWRAGKLAPKKYGEKIDVNVDQKVEHTVKSDLIGSIAEIATRMRDRALLAEQKLLETPRK